MERQFEQFAGKVVRGDGRGRALGFPTANMMMDRTMAGEEGIWASWCRLQTEDQWRRGALHVGPRPTYADAGMSVELHILDFPDRDLYGEWLVVRPQQRIRGVARFDTEQALIKAITNDCEQTRAVLVKAPK